MWRRLLLAVVIGSVAQFALSFVVFFVLSFLVAFLGVPPYVEALGMTLNQIIIAVAIGVGVMYSHDWKLPQLK